MSASLAPECNEVKERYDTCFLKWYSEKYLRGAEKDTNECAGLFDEYRKCLGVALKTRGIDKLLDEAREDNKENDVRLTTPKIQLPGMFRLALQLGLAASLALAAACNDVIEKDVVVIGGGASGAYAAFSLREDYGKSVALIEKEKALGGHVDSWTDETGRSYDFGVVTYIDSGNATSFMQRLGLDLGVMPRATTTQEYFDFKTGEPVDFTPQPFPAQLEALEKFRVEAEKFEPLIQGPGYFAFPEPEDIPGELLMPFGEWLEMHDLQTAMPFIYSSTGLGVGNTSAEMTLYALQAFGASMARSTLGLQGSFVPASLRNQDIYDAVGKQLGDDVYYQSTVVKSTRTDDGVSVAVKSHATNSTTLVKAKRLLISIPPTAKNTAVFDLDENEADVLEKLYYNNEYTGLVNNANLAANWSYFNMPAASAPDKVLVLPEAPFTARLDAMGNGTIYRVTVVGDGSTTAEEAKALVQGDFDRLVASGAIEEPENGDNTVSWVDFSVHSSMHARVSEEELEDGFMQKFNALQGQRSTWWTGGAWAVNFQTHLWEYDDMIIPKMLEGLD
ncbi:NAD(P)-binding rossmann-like domain-containing protein [Sarocladium implicatum]|nr:NAD(P)-binding rossmann-like domain-containing protein [Sarocladium implicatum]